MAAAAGAGRSIEDRPSRSKERINLPPNVGYEYQAQDINAILELRAQAFPDAKDFIFRKSIDLLAHRKENGKSVPELVSKLLRKTNRTTLIPCNIGNNHWVGLLFKFDKACLLERAELIDARIDGVVPGELDRQLQLVFPGRSFEFIRGSFTGDVASSGAFLIENLLSRVIGAPSLKIVSVDNHEIRLSHLTTLKERAENLDISTEKREDHLNFFTNFRTRQFYNIPNFKTDQNYLIASTDHIKDSDDDGSDDEPFDNSFLSIGWKFNKLLFGLRDQALVKNILNIMIVNPDFTPEAWYDYAMRLLWAAMHNPEIKELLEAMLGSDFDSISFADYLVLSKQYIGYKGLQSIHNFFNFYYRVHSQPEDAFKFAPVFLTELIRYRDVPTNLLSMFARFAYCSDEAFMTPIQATIVFLKTTNFIPAYAEFLLAQGPLWNKEYFAEQMQEAMSLYHADLSDEDRFRVAAHFASRLMSTDVLAILNNDKFKDMSFNLLKAYDKNLSWLRGEPYSTVDAAFDGFDLKQFFLIRVTLILQLILEIEHNRMDASTINSVFDVSTNITSESKDVVTNKNKKLLVDRLLAELARDLISGRTIVIINYLNAIKISEEYIEVAEKLFGCFAAGVIQSFSDLPSGVSQIIPLSWDINVEGKSSHGLYLQVTATARSYIFNLHNYGDKAQKNNLRSDESVVYRAGDRDKLYAPHRLGAIPKNLLSSISESNINEYYLRVQRLLSTAFTLPKSEDAVEIYYASLHCMSEPMPNLLPGSLPNTHGNCVAYGFDRARYCATISYGEAWHRWLLAQEGALINRVKAHIPESNLHEALWLTKRSDRTVPRSYALDSYWRDLWPLEPVLLEPFTTGTISSARSATSFYTMAAYASTGIGRIVRIPGAGL